MQNTNDLEQLETLKAWWKDYGKFTLFSIAIAIAVSMGWQYWRQWRYDRTNQASMLYEQLLTQIAQPKAQKQKAVEQTAQQLVAEYPKTPYAIMAKLIEAQRSVESNNLQQALSQLQWAAKQNTDELLGQIIYWRLARVLSAMKKADEAQEALKQVNASAFLNVGIYLLNPPNR